MKTNERGKQNSESSALSLSLFFLPHSVPSPSRPLASIPDVMAVYTIADIKFPAPLLRAISELAKLIGCSSKLGNNFIKSYINLQCG